MASKQEEFTLPRSDWYDDLGRIYKDRLIENFNAIQAKLQTITELDPWATEPPDVSSYEYPDSTLDSDLNKIINLKSFINIMNLAGYPLECVWSYKTITKLSYYDIDGVYRTIKDQTIDCSTSKPYIHLNYGANTVTANSSPLSSETTNTVIIAVYKDSKVYNVNSSIPICMNILQPLSNMTKEVYYQEFNRGTRGCDYKIVKNNRWVGTGNTNTRSGSIYCHFMDLGRKGAST